jgi:dihydrofolate reductase
MRKVIYGINMTLDGCCDHTKVVGHEEIHEYFTDLMRDVDLLVYGRKTYELMVPFWPDVAKKQSMSKVSNEFARVFDSIDKLVFSQTLESVGDRNTKISRADPGGRDIKIKARRRQAYRSGRVSLSSHLIALGLVDEYNFVVQRSLPEKVHGC